MAPLTLLMTVFLISRFCCSSTFSQGSPRPRIEVTPTVIRESDTVQLSCVASQPPHRPPPAECSFYIQGVKETPLSSCQYSVTAQELLKRAKQRSPAEINITCSYMITDSQRRYPSETSRSASLTVLGPSPQMNVALKHESDVAHLNCGTHQLPPVSGCHFYFVGKEVDARHAASCHLTVRGRDLIRWQGQNLPIKLQMGCFYYEERGYGIRSLYDLGPSVEVTELPKPEVKVFPAVTGKSQTFHLSCEVYASSPASQCNFYFMGDQRITRTSASCQLSLTWKQIAQLTGQELYSPTDVTCFYTISSFPSDHSSSVSVEQLPIISVNNKAADGLTMITCEIYRHSADVISCNLFIAEHLFSKSKSKQSNKKDGHSNCIFYVSRADLLKHLQSARGEGVSCNYTVNTKPPTHSTRSAKYIIPGFPPTTKKPKTTSDPGFPLTTKKPKTTSDPAGYPLTTKKPKTTSDPGFPLTTKKPKTTSDPAGYPLTTKKPKTTSDPAVLSVPLLIILVVAPSILVIGLLACFLWRFQRSNPQRSKHNSNIIRQHQHVEMVPVPVSSTLTVADDPAGTYTMISTVPPASDEEKGDEQDVSNPYHVYSSISDMPSVTDQRDQTYSLLQDHRSGVTQNMTYSLPQMH
ncbi:uncharacterized protein LOC143104461 isoform X3 [Alosa pseudoharengus]|uniref:uncharacterized protein LOC143104461 isoform X3 n=1 Tax=Alosa pseudoharengus TaxID=34774 RepID=UPI003F8BB7A5